MRQLKVYFLIAAAFFVFFFAPLLFTTTRIAANTGDIYLHSYPLKFLVSEHLTTGKMPLWNPYLFAGQPLLANPQSAVFYPPSIFFYLFPLPMAFNYFFVFHLFLGGFFMYLLLSSLRLPRTAALAGSMIYPFSSFFLYHLPSGHPVALSGYIWLPLVILGLEQVRTESSRGWVLFLALALSFQFLAGHSQPVFITFAFILFHFFATGFRSWKNLLSAGGFFLLFVSLQGIPALELSQCLERDTWPYLTQYYSLTLKHFCTIFTPGYFGTVLDKTYPFTDPSLFYERHAQYIGIVPLFLAGAGMLLSFRSKRFFYPAVIAGGVFFSLGFNNPLYRFLYPLLPGLSLVRSPASFYLLSLTGLAVCAAAGWQHFVAQRKPAVKIALLLVIAGDLFSGGTGT